MSRYVCGYNSLLRCLGIIALLGLMIFIATGMIVAFYGR